ncbi:MAG: amidohydrolase family protein [Acidobacteria bacterium]|nr:amidohydrolase family protein [Acidobacteriota bacterium]
MPLLLFAATALAQPLTIVRADRYVDVERGRYVSPAVIVVLDGKIESVNPRSVPAGATELDLSGKTLLPGLIDSHTHLTYDIGGDWLTRAVKETAADEAIRGVRNAKVTLDSGFTTVRNVGSGGFADIALMRGIERGLVEGPRIIAAGHSISITGGHCDATGWAPGILEGGPESGIADGADEALAAARYQIKHGAKVIKICATAGVLSFEESVGAQQMTDEEMRAVVEEAARHELKVAAHAHGTEGIKAAIRAGVASIEHGSLIDDEAMRMMKERRVFLVPTTYLVDALELDALPPLLRRKAEFVLPEARKRLREAIAAEVPIAFGTDSAVYPHGDNAKELGVLVDLGMTPAQALRTATLNAAELLGVDDRATIAPGKLADMIAVDGDPLRDVSVLEDVDWVMKGGTVYFDERE